MPRTTGCQPLCRDSRNAAAASNQHIELLKLNSDLNISRSAICSNGFGASTPRWLLEVVPCPSLTGIAIGS